MILIISFRWQSAVLSQRIADHLIRILLCNSSRLLTGVGECVMCYAKALFIVCMLNRRWLFLPDCVFKNVLLNHWLRSRYSGTWRFGLSHVCDCFIAALVSRQFFAGQSSRVDCGRTFIVLFRGRNGTLCLDCCVTLATALLALAILWRHSFSQRTNAVH